MGGVRVLVWGGGGGGGGQTFFQRGGNGVWCSAPAGVQGTESPVGGGLGGRSPRSDFFVLREEFVCKILTKMEKKRSYTVQKVRQKLQKVGPGGLGGPKAGASGGRIYS